MFHNGLVNYVIIFLIFYIQNVSGYWVGAGIGDITGPAADVNLMGYAMPGQVAGGIHMRLFARTIVFGDEKGNFRFAFVSTDNGMASYAVTREVVKRVNLTLPGLYSEDNIAISGTHSHSGPAGFSQNVLYQVTSYGFVHETFEAFVTGITESIINAHKAAKKGRSIDLSRGQMKKNYASINRSPSAYQNNPEAERNEYNHNTDLDMTLLKITEGDKNIAMLNWFAVHGTTMPNTNSLLSGDNKGFASQVVEFEMNGQNVSTGKGEFIALFASTNLGDVSPNINGTFCSDSGLPCDELHSTCKGRNENCHGRGPSSDPFESVSIIGNRQVELAKNLWKKKNQTKIDGDEVDFVHVFRDMSNINVKLDSGETVKTCKPSMGYSFAAGTTDGPGAFDFTQATTTTNPFWELLRNILKKPSEEIKNCQHPKAVLLPTGEMSKPYDWDPSIVPLQLLRLGKQLAIIVVPSEFTTMAGRRIRKKIRDILVKGGLLDEKYGMVVIAGLANEYNSYTTTFEEYQIQRYEGGSTLYGPHSLEAYIQEFSKLAKSMVDKITPVKGQKPPNFMDKQLSFLPFPPFDTVPHRKKFGQIIKDVKKSYLLNDTNLLVSAVFHSANPRNNFRLGKTFLAVQKLQSDGKSWKTIKNDADYDTRFIWKRNGLTQSEATVEWRPNDSLYPIQAGTYRLIHYGDNKLMIKVKKKIKAFKGYSSTFKLVQGHHELNYNEKLRKIEKNQQVEELLVNTNPVLTTTIWNSITKFFGNIKRYLFTN